MARTSSPTVVSALIIFIALILPISIRPRFDAGQGLRGPRAYNARMEQFRATPSAGGDYRLNAEPIGEPFHRFQALKASDFPAAVKCFTEFKSALARRIHWEEEEVLPKFQQRVGGGLQRTCDRLRQEHQEVLKLLDTIAAKLASANPATEPEEADLQRLLAAHNHKEHDVVFPALE
jgi:hypothetical protein